MHLLRKVIAGLLCLCLLFVLYGCSSEPADPATSAPATLPPTEPTEPEPQPIDIYNEARAALDQAKNLKMTVTYKTERTVGGETYTQQRTASAGYFGIGSDSMVARSEETWTFGSYETKVVRLYTNKTAYSTFGEVSFSTPMTPVEFTGRELPAVLLNAANYQSVTMKDEGGVTEFTFADAVALENWVTTAKDATPVSAGGTAQLNTDGALTQFSYAADYTVGSVSWRTEATVTVTVADEEELPASTTAPENCVSISCYDAPLLLVQAAGDIFTAKSISSNAQEMLVCNAAALVRTAQTEIDLYGSGSDFLANVDATASVTDYTGKTTATTQLETFRNGSYSYAVDGGTPTTQAGVTAAIMRSGCEDLLLSNLFTPEFIRTAELTDTGDFYLIRFTGNDDFSAAVCEWIYSMLGINLDDYASSFNTTEASGYLAISKATGLPTGMGQTLKRTHIIENVSYPLTYECYQSLSLSSSTSYKAVTDELAPETQPATPAKPLFYKVTGQNGQTMWLLGTIHIGDERTGFLPQQIYDAFNDSDALAVEIDVDMFEQKLETDATLQQQVAAGYYYTDGSTVSAKLDAELYKAAKDLMLVSGNYGTVAESMKPALWENAINNFLLQESCDLIADKGVDQRLLTLARKANKPIWDIEDPVAHALLTTNYSPALQAYLLKGTMETSVADYGKEVTELYELWCKGDEAALTVAVKDDVSGFTQEEIVLYSEYYKAMMTDRNAIMLQKAQQYLESGDTVFFAVGLAHVLGYDGLVEALRTAGYTVELVTYH